MSCQDKPEITMALPPGIAETNLFGPIAEGDELPPEPDYDPLKEGSDRRIDDYLIDLIDEDDEERDDDAMLELLAELGVDLGAADEPEELVVAGCVGDEFEAADEAENGSEGSIEYEPLQGAGSESFPDFDPIFGQVL